jgi:hypothetical protein
LERRCQDGTVQKSASVNQKKILSFKLRIVSTNNSQAN